MKKIIFKPSDFECTFSECYVGFFLCEDMIGFKSEYGETGYCDTGEYFKDSGKKVIPLYYEIINTESADENKKS